MKEIEIKIQISNKKELDECIEKAQQLVELLTKIQNILNSL